MYTYIIVALIVTHYFLTVFGLGLFSLLLEYTLKYGPSNDRTHKECKDKCYELMRRIARKNPKVNYITIMQRLQL